MCSLGTLCQVRVITDCLICCAQKLCAPRLAHIRTVAESLSLGLRPSSATFCLDMCLTIIPDHEDEG